MSNTYVTDQEGRKVPSEREVKRTLCLHTKFHRLTSTIMSTNRATINDINITIDLFDLFSIISQI